jgi:hypothetical protein
MSLNIGNPNNDRKFGRSTRKNVKTYGHGVACACQIW